MTTFNESSIVLKMFFLSVVHFNHISFVSLQSLKLLSVMAVIRLDDEADNVENTLSLALTDSSKNAATSITKYDPLASSTWEKVSFTTDIRLCEVQKSPL